MRITIRNAEWGPVELRVPNGTPVPDVGETFGLEAYSGGSEHRVIRRSITYFLKMGDSPETTEPDSAHITLYVEPIDDAGNG